MIRFVTLVAALIAATVAVLSLVPEVTEILDDASIDPRWFLLGAGLAGLGILMAAAFAAVDKVDRARQAKRNGVR